VLPSAGRLMRHSCRAAGGLPMLRVALLHRERTSRPIRLLSPAWESLHAYWLPHC
jgi:hypothetical protein